MKILFLTMTFIPDMECRYIYTELLKVFIKNGHEIIVVTPNPSKEIKPSRLSDFGAYKLLHVYVTESDENNLLRKAYKLLTIQARYRQAIKNNLLGEHFDLILYSTPPITLNRLICQIKKKHNALTYLMLKDIFPQNAVDLGMLSKRGLKRPIYEYFRHQEKSLYKVSDYIGCMSEANIEYLINHNPKLDSEKVRLCVNSIIPVNKTVQKKDQLKHVLELPEDRLILFYGGNLGKPQGIHFFKSILLENRNRTDIFFVICGNGTEKRGLNDFIQGNEIKNVRLNDALVKSEFDRLLSACDVGLLFLDYRFTIPNFPSRILSYMEYELPVLAATDKSTDIRQKIVNGDFGWWCESREAEDFTRLLNHICMHPGELIEKGKNARKYLETFFTAEITYRQITDRFRIPEN